MGEHVAGIFDSAHGTVPSAVFHIWEENKREKQICGRSKSVTGYGAMEIFFNGVGRYDRYRGFFEV